ncbi:hypothetical protein V6Z12_D01G087900 [Gossypium hirsutum]
MKRKKTPSLTLVSSLSTAATHSLLHRLISASRALPSCLLTTDSINNFQGISGMTIFQCSF